MFIFFMLINKQIFQHELTKDLQKQIKRDEKKQRIAKERGIKLITIRYDEELNKELLLNKIENER